MIFLNFIVFYYNTFTKHLKMRNINIDINTIYF